jgi:CubicO group peptidase (beta-lactamase class C family)
MNNFLPVKSNNKHVIYLIGAWVIIVSVALFVFSDSAVANEYASAAELKLMEGFPPPADKRVNRSNAISTPPYIRWSYLNMRSVYPTVGIGNADKASEINKSIDKSVARLKVKNPESGKLVDMKTYFKETYTDALLVVKGNKVVFEKYLNGMNANQPHQMMSVTKSFAGLMGLLAVEEGKAKETDPVTKYVPELKKSGAFGGASFGQVLDMTNAMDFSEDYDDPASGIFHYTIVLGLMEPVPGKTYAANIYDFLVSLGKDPKHGHGDIFHYQTPKTDAVNWVTNRATGQSFQDDMYHKLWSKLGTDGETYVLLDKDGTLFAGGGLNATPNDLARFSMMMLNNGKFNGKQVISSAIIKTLSDGGDIDAFSNGPESFGVLANKDWSYRAQWWIRHTLGKEAFMAIGIHGQWIYLDVNRKIAIVKQSSQPVSDNNYYNEYNLNAFDVIIGHLSK